MSNSKHTPGPWFCDGTYVRQVDTGRTLLKTDDIDFINEEAEANAHLIAAAPDLLAALERIYYLTNLEPLLATKYSVAGAVMQQIADALAKARGEL